MSDNRVETKEKFKTSYALMVFLQTLSGYICVTNFEELIVHICLKD